MSLPGADVLVPQALKPDASIGRGGVVLHEVARPKLPMSIVVASAMLTVRWLLAKARIREQETTGPTPEQLSSVKFNNNLDLFRSTCKVLRIPKAIERISAKQKLMAWFRAVVTSWMYERSKRPGKRKPINPSS